jgi:hypothetical protein
MGFRHFKAIKIAPGLNLNLNARSVSLTAGVPGAHLTYNTNGYRTTSLSAPGTRLSYRTTRRVGATPHTARATAQPTTATTPNALLILKAIVTLIVFNVVGCIILQVVTGHWWLFFVGVAAGLIVLRVVRSISSTSGGTPHG